MIPFGSLILEVIRVESTMSTIQTQKLSDLVSKEISSPSVIVILWFLSGYELDNQTTPSQNTIELNTSKRMTVRINALTI